MSERKSAEIKFRCTPSFKSGLQAAAEAAGQTLTEYVESAVWSHQNAQLGDAKAANPLFVLDASGGGSSTPVIIKREWAISPSGVRSELQPLDAPTEDAAPCTCRPWEYCTHKSA